MANWFIALPERLESARRTDWHVVRARIVDLEADQAVDRRIGIVRGRHLHPNRPRDAEHAQDAERETRLYQAASTISTASPTRISPGSTIVA